MTRNLGCPYCDGTALIRYGTRKGVQIYYCKPCRKRFTDSGAEPGRRVPPEQVGAAVSMFFDGLSTEDIRRNFGHIFDFEPSTASVYEWVRDYSDLAEKHLNATKPTNLGDTWVADEMVVKADRRNIWRWTVMDAKTRFILANHVSRSRTLRDATKLFQEARDNAGWRMPRTIVTDGLSAYPAAIERTFGAHTRHEVSGSVAGSPNNNLIERLNGTIRERTKVMRGLHTEKTADELLEGWTVHYNYFRPHGSLRRRTPARAAGIDTDLHNWEDVARLDVRPISHARSQRERTETRKRFGKRLLSAQRRMRRANTRLLGAEPRSGRLVR